MSDDREMSPANHDISRRSFLQSVAGAAALSSFGLYGASPNELALGAAAPFSVDGLHDVARTLAAQPYKAVSASLPGAWDQLTYDQYRQIRFRPDYALWQAERRFSAQFFHLGFYYREPVRVYAVNGVQAREILYTPEAFEFPPGLASPTALTGASNFAGFRLHTTLNTDKYADELVAFLGASYFRALGRGMRYGLSARGLAIDTAADVTEEFPVFRAFYLEHPANRKSITVHALLDSPGVAGVYSFRIQPGVDTVMDIDAVLYPRRTLAHVGLAPLSSMFLFAPQDREGVDDFRDAVHDSDGLMLLTGNGEWLWRPLLNPNRLRTSTFQDHTPRGFGLIQRERSFHAYEDLEARYDTRPSAWIEPSGDWGQGAVVLLEIPTDKETNDNIVCFWQPQAPLEAGGVFKFAYRLHWCTDGPRHLSAAAPARALTTRVGRGGNAADPDEVARKFAIEFAGDQLPLRSDAKIRAVVSASAGRIDNVTTTYNDIARTWRVYFDLIPDDQKLIELRCFLKLDDKAMSETWSFQWTN